MVKMDITIKTKFDKGDKVIVKIKDDTKKLDVFVLAEVGNVKQIVRLGLDLNKITYGVETYKIGEYRNQFISVDEDQILSLDDFTKLFERIRN